MNPLIPVSRLMTTNLITVRPDTPLGEASQLYAHHELHHLLVVEEGKLVGMLSTSDFLRLLDRTSTASTVADIMTRKLVKVEPDDTVRTAANLFRMNRFHALPVMGPAGEAVGIITTHDLIRLLDEEEVELGDYRDRK